MLFRILTVLLLAASLAYADSAPLTAAQWLANMNQAMKRLDYQGTVIFMKNGQLDTMKYSHSVIDGVEEERLSSLNSPLREVTRKASEVSCLFKEIGQKVINHHPIDRSFLVDLPSHTDDLETLYSLSLDGQEAVAMLPAQIVAIQPQDKLRYARKIWIEKEHFLPLKTEVYHLDGSLLEQMVFTTLTLDTDRPPHLSEGSDQRLQVKHIHAAEAEPFEQAPFWLKNWPAGFKTVFFIRNSLQKARKPVNHLLISDGLSSVSVYLEPKEGQGLQGLHTLGSVNSFSRVIDGFQLTVLGEVPAETVEMIAAGIALR